MPAEKPYIADLGRKLVLTPDIPTKIEVQDPSNGKTFVAVGDWWIGTDADGLRLCIDIEEEVEG